MKQLLPLILGLALCAPVAGARGTMTLQGTTFTTDTLQHYYIGPGMTHTQLLLSTSSRTVRVYAASYDKTQDTKGLGAVRVVLGNDSCRTTETITSMAKRKSNDSRRHLAGINADFFITSSFASQHEMGTAILGYPNMSCAIDGKLAAPDIIDQTSRENALIMGPEGWWIDATDLQYKLLSDDGSVNFKTNGVNYPRRDNEVIVYNSFAGKYTNTAAGGREIALVPADGAKWKINTSVKFIVDSETPHTGGNMKIPADGIVISCGPSYHHEFIDGLKKGDVVKLKIICALPAFEKIKPNITDIVGGDVRILNSGTVTTQANRWINTPSAKYARSLVGYSQDRNLMVMAAVDGGATSSGLTYYESADLMAALGCYDALDFDGGGSTALYLSHKGIVNTPRDGSERAVGNGLFFAVDAPRDNAVASIRFSRHALNLPVYASYTPEIYTYNAAGELLSTTFGDFTLSCPEGLGTITPDGSLMVTGSGTHALTATTADGLTATIPVTANTDFPATTAVTSILTDHAHNMPVPLTATVDGKDCPLSPLAFQWTIADPEIAEVDPASGTVRGLSNGTTTLNIHRGDIDFNIPVTVEISHIGQIDLTPTLVAEGSKVNKSGLGDVTLTQDTQGFTAEFDITSTRSPRVAFANETILYGLPDYIATSVTPLQGVIASQYIVMKSNSETRTTNISLPKSDAAQGVESNLQYDLAETYDTGATTTFPLRLTQLNLLPDATGTNPRHCVFRVNSVSAGYNHFSTSALLGDACTTDRSLRYIMDAEGITTPETSDLYTTGGFLLSRGTHHALPGRGIYILRANNRAAKILVR